ncbi:MAG: LPS-assembly protein LptD [Gemmatimonadetes bacterium]|nr:LPS-assembly protein LptD [Gemmatimonadota bacterium]
MSTSPRFGLTRALACAALLAVVAFPGLTPALHAQQPPAAPLRDRILKRLQRLAENRPGLDTLAADTAGRDTMGAVAGREPPGAAEPGARPATGARRGGEGADTVMAALLELPNYQATSYQGADARFDIESRTLVLEAAKDRRAQVVREGEQLTADSAVIYHDDRDLVEVHGDPTYTPKEGDPVQSRIMFYDLSAERGSALGARTKFQQQGEWFVQGDLPSIQSGVIFGSHTRFTSCDLEVPHSHFEAKEIKMVADGVMVARPVVLYFSDVPVAWLPFIAQSLKRGRRSGLLTPVFSVNDVVRSSRRYDRRLSNVGFYWALSDYGDAQLALDWFSNRFIAVTGGTRYRWLRQFLEGSLSYRQYWRTEGGNELALDTQHSWQLSERMDLRASARYASSTDFVRRNSFDPREVTQSIDSEGGLNRRFDWGNLSLSANRRQFLSDDRVEMTLPNLSLSLSPLTLFRAAQSRASWYNNLTWSGSANFSRDLQDRPDPPDTAAFRLDLADQEGLRASFSSSLNAGNLGWSQGVSFSDRTTMAVPDTATGERRDLTDADLGWQMGFDYQQRLVGSTTFTPQLSLSGRALRSDRKPEASSFVSAPLRLAFGAQLKSDIYGFFPGFAGFSRVRHKVSPTIQYSYTPTVRPTELQTRVFGERESKARNEVRVGLNQTFEAKVEEPSPQAGAAAGAEQRAQPDTARGPRRRQQARIVNLLSLQTSAVTYDFVRAQETGDWREGFTTTRVSNQISSDFLRGLSLSVEHELFQQEGSGAEQRRRLAPRLSQLNMSFALSSTSGVFRWLGLARGETPAREAAQAPPARPQPEPQLDPSAILPGARRDPQREQPAGRGEEGGGGWNANLSYSLTRPTGGLGTASQALQIDLSFSPTANWDVRWNTSYDAARGTFNDHILTLTRDLHEWQAHFDFRQTAAGNWSFQFRVELRNNPDLKFEYDQRSSIDTGPARTRR